MRPLRQPYMWLPALLIGMTVVALVIGGFTLHYVETRLVASTGESLALAAADIADKLDRILSERYTDTQVFAGAEVFRGHDPKAKSEYMTWLQQLYPFYQWIAVTDARGTIIAATNPRSIGKDRSADEWFRAVRDGRATIHVRDAQKSEDSGGVMAVAFTAPIKGARGEFLGAVTTRFGLPAVEDVFARTTRTLQLQRGISAGRIEWQFMTRDGEVIVDSVLRQEGMVNLKNLGEPSALLTGSAQPGYIEEAHFRRHVRVITGYAQTEQSGDYLGLHWGILVRVDRSDILAPVQTVLWKLGAAGALVFVPMLGFLVWSTGRLRREWAFAQEETARSAAAEAVTQEVQEWLFTILKSIGDAVIVTDKNGSVTFMNAVAESLTGWKEEEARSKPLTTVFQIVNEKTRQPVENPAVKVMQEGIIAGLANHTVLIAKDGAERPIDDSGAPIRDAQGNLIGVVLVFRDITERKATQEEMRKAKAAAEAANLAKSEFLASMSHEIRTPMNAIIGMADLLAETPLSEEQANYVRVFRRAGDSLLNLINDILDLSKVEASQLELDRTGFDLNEVVEKVAEMLAVRAHEKCLELVGYIAPEAPTYLVGDPMRLRQVVVNLLGNAIKFTESGEVVLRVELDSRAIGNGLAAIGEDTAHSSALSPIASSPSPAQECVLRFSVSDNGIGIPPDKLDAIFDRFTQVDSSTTRKYGGTGLGLAITRRLVELMGGRIWVESALGFGSTFHFTAPFEVQPPTQRSPSFKPVTLRGLRTLVVDDNDTNRLILRQLLSSWNAVVTEAATGAAALAELQRAQATSAPYELVLLDCRMPGMDGFQVAEAIRDHPSLTGVTMMMLTSDNRKDHIQRVRELGLAGYVVKPIRRTDLLEAVATAVSQSRSAASPTPPNAPPEPEATITALRILLAEDSADNRLLVQSYLKKTPHHLEIADNGAIAVAKVRAHRYDLVLMDMQMPVMDGYAATRAIRKWERETGRRTTPIIALTAYALKGDEEKALEAGCTAHVPKPVKKAMLLSVIQEQAAGVRS